MCILNTKERKLLDGIFSQIKDDFARNLVWIYPKVLIEVLIAVVEKKDCNFHKKLESALKTIKNLGIPEKIKVRFYISTDKDEYFDCMGDMAWIKLESLMEVIKAATKKTDSKLIEKLKLILKKLET